MTRFIGKHDMMDFDDFQELLADQPNDEKWELIDGRVIKLMVGARWEHHLIIQNMNFHITSALRAGMPGCRVFTETFRVGRRDLKSSTLPDLVVRCGKLDVGATSLDDPVVLAEIVSDGSRGRDKVEKRRVYTRFASLKHYVMVERDAARIEVLDRSSDTSFTTRVVEGLDAVLDLPAIGASLPLTEIYADVLEPEQ